MSAAPDVYAGPAFLGWRSWRVMPFERLGEPTAVRLCASGTNGRPKVWEPAQAMKAVCGKFETTHEAPAADCECGFYAYRQREPAEEHLAVFAKDVNGEGALGWAFGRVSLWGRIVECVDGWRAEYAYPYELTVYGAPEVAAAVRNLYRVDVEASIEELGPRKPGADDAANDEADELELLVGSLERLEERFDEIRTGLKLAGLDGLLDGWRGTKARFALSSSTSTLTSMRLDLERLSSIDQVRAETAVDLAELADKIANDLLPKLEAAEFEIGYQQRRRVREAKKAAEKPPRPIDEATLPGALATAIERSDGDAFVTAGAVACALFDDEHVSHAERIRVGQALGRLARSGGVRRVERPGHESYGWALVASQATNKDTVDA